MEELRQIDLTYITERIISIICSSACPEDLYLQNLKKIIPMLESKHGHNYMVRNADLSLDHFAMRKFYNDKLSALMIPSQKRYVWMVGSMFKGELRMNHSQSFLLCVVLYGLPKIRPDEDRRQPLICVCLHLSHVNAAQTDRLYIVLQPAQLLKGDIMVVGYDKNKQSASRQVVFRLQFHTGLVVGHSLSFCKADLDCAAEGSEQWLNGHSVTVDYDTLDPLVRRDSFQDWTHPQTGGFFNT
ncbi:hypothetical protein GOODEAATRI_002293 [Goodea atripinnis]|uniref:C2 tensin-type domain-containing protein n=1 Tax=Goodea atripinnis TaxID=208336 RepID=A0ABV0P154_9TELE